jgi:hypothetical protein
MASRTMQRAAGMFRRSARPSLCISRRRARSPWKPRLGFYRDRSAPKNTTGLHFLLSSEAKDNRRMGFGKSFPLLRKRMRPLSLSRRFHQRLPVRHRYLSRYSQNKPESLTNWTGNKRFERQQSFWVKASWWLRSGRYPGFRPRRCKKANHPDVARTRRAW